MIAIAVGAMFLPSILSWDAGTYTLRSMGLVPAVYLVPALGLDAAWRGLAKVVPVGPRAATAIVGLILLVDGAWTARDYFVVWAPSFGASYEGWADSVAQARFLAANAHPASEEVGTMEGLGWPPPEWRAGDVVWSELEIPVPSNAAAGLDRVQLALDDTHTGARVPVYGGQPGIQALILGQVRVTSATTATPPRIHLGARVGPDVQLLGIDPPRLADPSTLAVTLAWSADRPLQQDYTVFVQFLGPDGKLVAQSDSWPAAGNLPTTSWLPGEVVRDEHHLTLKPGLAPGRYRLIAGLYLLSTGQRLSVASGGDFVDLESLSLPIQ